MAFAVTDDLRHLVILSDRNTRKFANLAANRRVALLIDDRGNKTTDTQESIAVTVLGLAFESDADNGDARAQLFPGSRVPPGDVPALQAALQRLINEPALREQLAAGAREAGRRLPDWPTQAARFTAVLDALP